MTAGGRLSPDTVDICRPFPVIRKYRQRSFELTATGNAVRLPSSLVRGKGSPPMDDIPSVLLTTSDQPKQIHQLQEALRVPPRLRPVSEAVRNTYARAVSTAVMRQSAGNPRPNRGAIARYAHASRGPHGGVRVRASGVRPHRNPDQNWAGCATVQAVIRPERSNEETCNKCVRYPTAGYRQRSRRNPVATADRSAMHWR